MENKKSDNTSCCSCDADFKNEINELVDNVEKHDDHSSKQQELDEAFTNKNTEDTSEK